MNPPGVQTLVVMVVEADDPADTDRLTRLAEMEGGGGGRTLPGMKDTGAEMKRN